MQQQEFSSYKYLFYKYWDLSTEMTVMKKIVLFLVAANQRRERWNFTSEKSSFAASDWTNDVFHQWKVIVRQATSSLARKLASPLFIFKMSQRFVDVGSVDNFIAEQENKAT